MHDELNQYGGEYKIYSCDISKSDQVIDTVNKIKSDFGQIDILINNAGIGYNKKFIEHSIKEIHDSFAINVLGLMYMSHEIIPMMKKASSIINIGSILSTETWPDWTVYESSKYAVLGLTEGLRKEMLVNKTGIRVMGFYPGGMNTNIAYANDIPYPDWSWAMNPDDVANSIIFMLQQNEGHCISHIEFRSEADK